MAQITLSGWKRIVVVTLGSGWFFLASCTGAMIAGTKIVADLDARSVSSGDELHRQASVVLPSAESDTPFAIADLADAMDDGRDIRMPLPAGQWDDRESFYSYEVIEDSGAKQLIEVVEQYRDGDNTIWTRYEATATGIIPVSSRMWYYGYSFVALPYAIGFATLLYALGRFLAWRYRDPNEPAVEPKNRRVLMFFAIYGVGVAVLYVVSTPTISEDFSGVTGRYFTVAGVATNVDSDESRYRVFRLEALRSGELDLDGITFLLPQPNITINVGDIHRAAVTEDHGDWQLVTFYYANTRTTTSVYRAYADRVEPVSYRLTSSAGLLSSAVLMLIPAVFLTSVITAVLNWRTRRARRQAQESTH